MITAEQIFEVMSNAGVGALNAQAVDSNYATPTRRWLLEDFARATAKNLKALGLAQYEAESWDCDDFAWLVASLARMNHRINGQGKTKQNALAVGMFAYVVDGGGGHAIVFAIVRKGTGYVPIFIEPQNSKEVTLSAREKDNCIFWLI